MPEKAKILRSWLTKTFSWLAAAGSIVCLIATEALAASSSTQPQNGLGAGLGIAWGIAYLTRRQAIGGWLLYFYFQLYLSLLLSLGFLPNVISNLDPTGWDSAMRYVLFVLSTVPIVLAQVLEVFAATQLLIARNERNLWFLRKVLIALLVASTISLSIDIVYFSDAPSITLDMVTFVFACIWTAYFWKSERVRLVFIAKTWHYFEYSARRSRTPEEKRYLRKRAAIAGAVTFIVVLVMMGVAMGDKRPDSGIFAGPIFLAFVAAAIGWYVPIRKKKLDALPTTKLTNAETEH